MPPLYRIIEIILYSLLNFLPYLVFALYPFRNKLRFSLPITILLVTAVTFVQIGLGLWAGLFSTGNAGLISLVSTVVYMGFYFSAVKAHFGKTLFTLLLLSNIANFVVNASKCIEGLIFPDYALEAYRWTFSISMIGVQLIILLPLFLYFKRNFSTVFEKDTAKPTWRFLWLIPTTFYIIWYYHLYGSSMSSLQLALQPVNTFFLLLINLGALLIYHMVVQHINIIDKNVRLEQQNHALALQNVQYNYLQDKISEARQAKHDIRHHISIMESYLLEHEYDKLEEYLCNYKKSLPDSNIVYCDNRAVNVLLTYFSQEAEDNDIDFKVSTHLPENLGIPENDLSVLLGNLLENALDACMEQQNSAKRIIIKAKANSSSVFFTIDNTFEGMTRQTKQGIYLSTKKHGSGLGLASVGNIVKRYNGSMVINHKNGMFRVSIMLNLPIAF